MKTQLATAIAFSLLAGTTFAAPTFYGEVDLSLDYLTAPKIAGEKGKSVTDLDSNNSFIGLKGDEKLTDRLSALYQAEFTLYADNGENNDKDKDAFVPRNILVGLKDKQLGTLKVGKIDTPVKQLSAVVDTFNNYLANNGDIHGIMGGETRLDNTLVYETPAFPVADGKLEAKVQLATGEGADKIKATKGGYTTTGRGLGDSFSSSVVYSDDLVVVGLGYDRAVPTRFLGQGFLKTQGVKDEFAANFVTNVIAEANTWRAIGRVNLDNGLSLRGLYQTSKVKDAATSLNVPVAEAIDKSNAWLLGAEYNLPEAKAWTVKAQYSANDVKFNDNTTKFKANQILAGVDYAFNKQVKVYGHAGHITLKQDEKAKQAVVGTGIEYKF